MLINKSPAMKQKILIVMFCISGLPVYLHAQKISYEISSGLSLASYTKDKEDQQCSPARAGFIGGLAVNVKAGKQWAIQPGITFVQKGGKEQDTSSITKYSTTLNYVELPVNIRYSKRERCFFGFGLFASYGLSGNIKARKGDAGGEVKVKFGNADDELKPFETGINIFMGYRLPSNIFFSFNINGSFNNISNVPGGYFCNSYMGIRVGYVF
jgi:hypothetical protein